MNVTIPYQVSETEYDIIIALSPSGIERIQQYDPAEIDVRKVLGRLGTRFSKLKPRYLKVGFANDEDLKSLSDMLKRGDIKAVLDYLHKGFKVLPEDSDGPYHSLIENEKCH